MKNLFNFLLVVIRMLWGWRFIDVIVDFFLFFFVDILVVVDVINVGVIIKIGVFFIVIDIY